jgi:hypothetical protein
VLKDEGFMVDGEVNMVTSDTGKEIRASVRFKSSEGILSRLLNRMNINLDLSKILKP